MTTERDEQLRGMVQAALSCIPETAWNYKSLMAAEPKLQWHADQLGAAVWDDPRGMSGNFSAIAVFVGQWCRCIAAAAREIRGENWEAFETVMSTANYWGALARDTIARATMEQQR